MTVIPHVKLPRLPIAKTIRFKLTLLYSAIVALTLTLFVLVQYYAVSSTLRGNFDTTLKDEARQIGKIIDDRTKLSDKPIRRAQHQSITQTKKFKRATPKQKRKMLAQDAKEKAREKKQLAKQLEEQKPSKKIASAMKEEGLDLKEVKKEGEKKKRVRDSSAKALPAIDPEFDVRPDGVWNKIYKHLLVNRKNNLLQISDRGGIIYQSENLGSNTLPLPQNAPSSLSDVITAYDYTFDDLVTRQPLRLAALITKNYTVIVGYPRDELDDAISKIFSTLPYLIPFALLFSLVSGWIAATVTLRPIVTITKSADDITAHHLSRRIPMRGVNDELERLTTTLNSMIGRLEESFVQIQQFSADASHELKTPLSILTGELELCLREERTTEEYQLVISSAIDEVTRLTSIVEDLLTLAKADVGRVTISHEVVDINDLLENIYTDAAVLASAKAIDVRFSGKDSGPLFIIGDKARLYQLFLNVVDNAIKYTPDGGRVTIDMTHDATHVRVAVSDTGIGIHASDIPHIFGRFYRTDKARSRAVGGSGLGLSIVKWITEAHDGTVDVRSEPGKGTIFIITLPIGDLQKEREAHEQKILAA